MLNILSMCFPNPKSELKFHNPFELLCAVVLSAQATDESVNKITPELFKLAPTPFKMSELPEAAVGNVIRTIGLWKAKASYLVKLSKMLCDEFNGEVPETIKDLMKLPGVGKKTANVVASTCFGVPAIAVDTHVFRVSNRIGFVNENNVEKTEKALQNKIDKDRWTKAHHLFIFHGRRCCTARSPKCQECTIKKYCRYYEG